MTFMKIVWRSILVLALIITAIMVGLTPAAAQDEKTDPQAESFPPGAALPDLQTLPITDLTLEMNPNTGARTLRFSNSVANTGGGPVELRGTVDEQSGDIVVSQHIYGAEETVVVPLEGTFYFSGNHMHWHWEAFTAYEIWTVETGGDLSRMVLANDKVGFCLFDTHAIGSDWIEENVEGELFIAPRAYYTTCQHGRQGISAGWVDVYELTLAGQALDVTELEDGVYALRSVADPLDAIYELDSENNDTVLYFSLHGDELIVLGEEFSLMNYFARLVDAGKIEVVDGKVVEENAGDGSPGEE
jgi:hypothetical protein